VNIEALAEVLVEAGITAIEITLRTDAALQAIGRVAAMQTSLIVGAGSIRRPDQFSVARDAGASFFVSPGCTPSLLDTALEEGLAFIPGAATASEMLAVFERGIDFIKFFPAENNGGVSTLKSISAPLPELKFFPTGGVNPANVQSYLALPSVKCVGGSWFIPEEYLESGDYGKIRDLAQEAVKICCD
jgi:2-dehydro-3-deoxyphosphogluconate aldolase/(4S)-4-hydroxy-2-oxoglutarate aldolase